MKKIFFVKISVVSAMFLTSQLCLIGTNTIFDGFGGWPLAFHFYGLNL